MQIRKEHIGNAVVGRSAAAFIVSLLLPTFLFERRQPLLGFEVLTWGWWGVLMLEFGWFANIAYYFGVRAWHLDRPTHARAASALAIGLGLTSFHAKEWAFSTASGTPIMGLGTGFYVWILSFFILFLWSCISWVTYDDASATDS